MAELISRLRNFQATIFGEMTALAVAHNAINLGQGFPSYPGPTEVTDRAAAEIAAGNNQYPPGRGLPELRQAIAAHAQHWWGLDYDAEHEVLVTMGATEALAASITALCEPGDEVIALEPFFDVYPADVALAGGVFVPVRLDAPEYRLDAERLAAAITDKTRLLILNSPHNPTGRVLTRSELEAIAELAIAHDLTVICDEVYEHLTFRGHTHIPLATLPGMRQRCLRISSAGKTFSTTGWKIGWVCGPAELVTAVLMTKQLFTYAGGTPFQPAVATGVRLPDTYFHATAAQLEEQKQLLVPALEAAGFTVHPTEGTYFVVADAAPLGVTDGLQLCRELPARCGVAAIPMSAFYTDPTGVESLLRFAFCKTPEEMTTAAERLRAAFHPDHEVEGA